MIDLQKILIEKINKLDAQITDVKYERDHAATPMESGSDKTRQLAEQMMDALFEERKKLILLKRKVNKYQENQIFLISTPLGERDFVLVPDGLGGKTINGITLLSEISPLGKKLKNQKVGDLFDYNNQEFKVISIKKDSA